MANWELHGSAFWVFALIFFVLIVATGRVYVGPAYKDAAYHDELKKQIYTSWVLLGLFTIAMLANRSLSIGFFAFVSFLALKEFLSLIPTRRAHRRVLFWAYISIPIQYYWVAEASYSLFIIFIPIYMFLFIPLRMVLIGDIKEFLKSVGILHWGLMTMVFSVSHVAYLLVLPEDFNPQGGGASLVLYLVLLTQINDATQYLWGKSIGRKKLQLKIETRKTWGGLIGGSLSTIALAMLVAPFMTNFQLVDSLIAGIIIVLGAFIGDVTMSALKQDLNLKHSGSYFSSGVLGRVDGLIYTGPLFFHFVYLQ